MRDPSIPQRHVAAAELSAAESLSGRCVSAAPMSRSLMFCSVRARMRHAHATLIGENTMSSYGTMRHGSPVAADGAIAARCGGALTAAYQASRPSSEWPISPDTPVRAGQLGCPLDGVVAVADVGVVVAEILAVGDVSAAHVLRDEDVAARRPEAARGMENARVRRALHDDAERPRARPDARCSSRAERRRASS